MPGRIVGRHWKQKIAAWIFSHSHLEGPSLPLSLKMVMAYESVRLMAATTPVNRQGAFGMGHIRTATTWCWRSSLKGCR
ncbi:hypothetical protein DESC_580125 [Desulfosarcina cetonica]|nr:hypothetical protein DESC_580125 [Desulfosarcina cetonica]